MAYINVILTLIAENWQNIIIGGAILVSSIICLVGLLKKTLFSKIKNKFVRKFVTAFSAVILVFPVTALYLAGNNVGFEHYWLDCLAVIISTILTYWLYENTLLREVITIIGNNTIVKVFHAIAGAIVKKDKSIQEALTTATEEVKTDAETELKNKINKVDDELKNL